VRRPGAAQLRARERQRDHLERHCRIERARLGHDAGQAQHDRSEQDDRAAEQQGCMLERVPSVTRGAGKTTAAAALERERADEKLQAVDDQQSQKQAVQGADDTPGRAWSACAAPDMAGAARFRPSIEALSAHSPSPEQESDAV
jgi:hypothetical protein